MSWTLLGMILCLGHSAMFSGLNLAMLGPSRLRLQVAATGGNEGAQRILELRQDFHLLLTTILWGNVAANTLLALLADSILTGVVAFFVSTVGITILGEIVPQAYFARYANVVGGALAPVIRVYRTLLLPVAWPTARLLDKLVGREGMGLFREDDLEEMIRLHILDSSSEVGHVEGSGALNFLALDDRRLDAEAEILDPSSILALPFIAGRVQSPSFETKASDDFLRAIHHSGHKWIVITDELQSPRLVLNANSFLRSVLMDPAPVDPMRFCHEPLVITDPETQLEAVLGQLQFRSRQPGRQPLHPDLVLLWTAREKRILTGVDLLEYLLRGVSGKRRN